MAVRLDPAIRKRLEDDGNWPRFCYRRTELRAKGETREDAERIALKELGITIDPNAPRVTPPGSSRKDGKTPQVVRETGKVFRGMTQEEARVPKKIFEGKECTFRDEVIWVAKNIEIRGVKPEHAPSSSAWALLRFARSSPTNLMYFWKDFYAKIHISEAKGESEDDRPFKDDGREILDTIEALQRAGDGAAG